MELCISEAIWDKERREARQRFDQTLEQERAAHLEVMKRMEQTGTEVRAGSRADCQLSRC